MEKTTILEEFQELNLAYLLLMQKMIAEDRDAAIFRLKLTLEMAELIESMSVREITWLATQGQFVLRPCAENAEQLTHILRNRRETGLTQTHLAMLMASTN
ncbi:flagellar transcriptional regulator FlhD [Aliidiomarina halalkaliphila]|uniref:Flagellar transcriptional regulator FlhD n=1 Tax=Aliidiomarina halalkaliphila TaxID=2593535 RepID=A0A552X1I0_9GAMM|nr:flagellar transcriptional regulator FlhD [Aliidiomarina halalkaliphila]TRW48835.1 flagellar transcriptional regulator FlhD [Aliidiomarina halalkaliphila]